MSFYSFERVSDYVCIQNRQIAMICLKDRRNLDLLNLFLKDMQQLFKFAIFYFGQKNKWKYGMDFFLIKTNVNNEDI